MNDSKIDMEKYRKNNSKKLDLVTTGIGIERHQKQFAEDNGINLSKLMRDILDSMIEDSKKQESVEKQEIKKKSCG